MAFSFSSNTRVYFGVLDMSGYLTDASLEGTQDVAETTTFGQSSKTYIPGVKDRTWSATGNIGADALAPIETAISSGTGVLTFCPGGASAIGDLAWLSSTIPTTLSKSANIGDVVKFGWDAQVSAGTAFGYVLHPLAEDTNTTTGAILDGGAATTTGATMHIHVTAVDGGSWVIKLVDGAASNLSDVADVAGMTSAAITTATSQRLVSAAGATVKRYTRYVATRTGGAGGDGITFQLSFSRLMTA